MAGMGRPGPFPTFKDWSLQLQRPAGAALRLSPRPSPSAIPTPPTPACAPGRALGRPLSLSSLSSLPQPRDRPPSQALSTHWSRYPSSRDPQRGEHEEARVTGGPTAPSQLSKTAAQLRAKRPSIINQQRRRARRRPSPRRAYNPFLPSAPRADPTRSAGTGPFLRPGHQASPVGWGRRPPWESPGRVGKGSGTCWSSGPWRGASPPATGPTEPGAFST